ncbi:TPA: oligosaccharide flippase family protein [Photobacterium damselae]
MKKEIIQVLLNQISIFVGGFIYLKILAINLSVVNFGMYSLLFSLVSMLSLFIFGPINQTVLRFGCNKNEGKELLLFFIIIVTIVIVLSMPSYFIKFEITGIPSALIFLAIITTIIRSIQSFLDGYFNSIRERLYSLILTVTELFFRIFIVFLFSLEELTPQKALISMVISSIIAIVINLFFSYKKINLFSNNVFDFIYFRKYFKYTLTFTVISGIAALCNYLDRWMINLLLDAKDVGYYSAVFQISVAPLILLSMFMTQYLSPLIFNGTIEDKKINYFIYSSIYAFFVLLIVFFYYYFSDLIIIYLLSDKYLSQSWLLFSITISLSPFYMANIFFIKLQKESTQKKIIIAWVIRVISYFVFLYFALTAFGLKGVVIANGVGATIFLIMTIYIFNKQFKVNYAKG